MGRFVGEELLLVGVVLAGTPVVVVVSSPVCVSVDDGAWPVAVVVVVVVVVGEGCSVVSEQPARERTSVNAAKKLMNFCIKSPHVEKYSKKFGGWSRGLFTVS